MDLLMALIIWSLFGLAVGALARLLVPGRQAMGFLSTILLGVAGSFLGGFVTYILRGGDPLQPTGFVGSLVGAIVVLLISAAQNRRRSWY
ncbi:MAG: GlsB/YeaQ/YmgE family stress response membrane protein [Planctomycetaceae bacterium]|nr:GlsB/YeaQ/YmgE family stress response membrane protein [Planctomycetaceae bacterium]